MSESDAIMWSAKRPLTWHDFKAESNPAIFEDAHSAITYRPTWITGSEEDGDRAVFFIKDVSVTAEFIPRLSWVRPGHSDDAMLRHEQGHFDMAELVWREWRGRFSGEMSKRRFPTRGGNEEQRKQNARDDSAQIVVPIVDAMKEDLARRRKEYDQETNFGADARRQSWYDAEFARLRAP